MIKPTKNKLLVEPISDMRQTSSGLWIAKTKKEVPHRGTVIAVGKEVKVKPGDIVHFKKYEWKKVTVEGKTCIFIWDDSIVGVESEKEN